MRFAVTPFGSWKKTGAAASAALTILVTGLVAAPDSQAGPMKESMETMIDGSWSAPDHP